MLPARLIKFQLAWQLSRSLTLRPSLKYGSPLSVRFPLEK